MAEMWYYTTEGKQMDAVTIKELKRLVGDGTLKPTDMVWKEGMPRWIRASSVKELFPDPTSALDQYFTSTLTAEKKDAQAQASGVTAPGKGSPIAPMPASNNNGSAPATQESQGKKRKTSAGEAEEDSRRPPRRRPDAGGGGSSIFIIVGLLIGGFLLLGALVGGVVILIFVIPKEADPNQPGIVEKDKKKVGPDGVAPINGEVKKEANEPIAKNDPLPPGVREGKGVVPPPKLALTPNGGAFLVKFRAKGGYQATITATCLGAKADSDLNIFVYRPNDMNTPIFSEDKAAHIAPNASVTFTLPKTEIVHVLVKNASRTTPNKCSIIYDVSP